MIADAQLPLFFLVRWICDEPFEGAVKRILYFRKALLQLLDQFVRRGLLFFIEKNSRVI